MYSKNRKFRVYENKSDKILYISLKFKGEEGKPIWKTIIMPQKGSKIPAHKVELNANILNLMENKKNHLKLPKFQIKNDPNLVDFMKYKNCTRLFNAATANLDQMFEGKRKDYI